jgi:F5/8 type C domain
MCKRQIGLVVFVLLLSCGMIAQADIGDGLKGLWEFGSADDLTAAKVGNDLVLAGDRAHTAMAGIGAGDGAVGIGVGSYYECIAGIAANGGGSMVNQYTLLFDFRYPSSSAGQYMCFFQTDTTNSNDGDYFISPSEDWGVGSISYASNPGGEFSVPDTWYRVILSVDQGSGDQFFRLYIDGVLIHTHGNSGTDGRHSLSADPDVAVLLFADENSEDPEIHCSTVAIWDRPLTAEEIAVLGGPGDTIVLFGPSSDPNPEDGATDIPRDAVLTWTAGEYAATHDIYLGTSFEDVNTADRANPLDVLLSQGQADASYDSDSLFDFGQTYYWRVDEVNAVPTTIFRDEVWSFTVEPFAYPVENITATSNASSQDAVSPANTVNGSGLNSDDEHSTISSDMWLGVPDGAEPVWLQYDFNNVYKLHQMVVWNYNVEFELMLGFGIKDVTVEYSENGTDWIALGDVELAQATARPDYTFNTVVDFGGVPVKSVRLTVNSGWGPMGQYGLSEVRFLSIPTQAREPEPADGAADVDVDTLLSWRAGREAVSHEVYYGTDAEALALADTVSVNSYTLGALNLGTTYYWKIDEVNEADAVTTWAGGVWSFTTQEFLVVDDFESYNDEDNVIYETWIDGWVNETGSTVGYLSAPFAERTIVNSGSQSMPLSYDNAGVTTAEAELDLGQNWTTNGVKSLSLYFYGAPDNTGQLYVKVNGTKVAYDGDITTEAWQPFTIDLSTVGGNLSNVSSLTIGVEGAGASGVVYVDDIRLYP